MISITLVELEILGLIKRLMRDYEIVWESIQPEGASPTQVLANLIEEIKRKGLPRGQSLESVVAQLRDQVRSAVDSVGGLPLNNREKQENLLRAAEAMVVIYQHMPIYDKGEDVKASRARCAWEASKYYGWAAQPKYPVARNDRQRYLPLFTKWLAEALWQDAAYARAKYRETRRQALIIDLLTQNPPLLAQLRGGGAISSAALGELTPLPRITDEPATDPVNVTAYDADFWHSHSYHFAFAEIFRKQGQWQDALTAIETAVWLMPRITYRKRLVQFLEDYAKECRNSNRSSCEALRRRADSERKRLRAEGILNIP